MVSRTSNRFTSRARRVMGFCVAAMLFAEGVMPYAATTARKLPKNLLPAPGNIGIVLNLLGVREGRPVVTTNEHPLFQTSWMGHPNEVVATTKYGSVTSQDLYLWMMLRESPNKAFLFESFQKSLLPEERKEMAKALRVEIDEYVFTNFVIPHLQPAVAQDAVYDLKHEIYTLPAWQTVFLEKVLKPTLCLTEADRQKYLQEHTAAIVEPERLRTRYIFMKSPETAVSEEQDRVEVAMDELRSSILRGEVDFAEAARQHSEAPSASRGGEIPPFQHGQLFYLFENAAAALEPGGISPVFRGPNGFYMVQLIEVVNPAEPSLQNPKHARLVDEGLSRQVLKSAFDIYMRDMLMERRRIVEKTAVWDSLEDCESVGEVCDFFIVKGNFRSAWPGVEDNNLKLRTDIIAPQLHAILEREAMAQDVRAQGFANDPILERARWMAGNMIRRDAWIDQLRATLPISEELVRNFWEEHQDLFVPLALKRVIRLTLSPSNTAPLPAQTRLELDQVLARAAGEPATVAVAQRKVQDEERDSLVYDPLERTENAFEMMAKPDEDMNFYLNQSSTSTLESLMKSDPLDVPSLEGEPAPGLDEMPVPSDVTTDTLDSLEPKSSSSIATTDTLGSLIDRPAANETLDLVTTSPQGGAAPGGAVGGELGGEEILPDIDKPIAPTPTPDPDQDAPVDTVIAPSAIPANVYKTAEPGPASAITVPKRNLNPPVLPATRPRSGGVPVGQTAPAISSALTLEPTPNIRQQLPPPETSSIPYNPGWFYARRNATDIRAVIGNYASSDWILTMEDLGFVYLEDLPDVPRKVEEVPVGAFTRPIVRGQAAVSWFIEEARTVEKQPFEKIKTHVYDVFRNTQIDKALSRTYNSELEKANVDYKF